jgi:imipenem/basic amino acid-specific outer membrane pore
MKKIILSVAAAAMALTTTAAALEDIKVNGQAKLWYETSNTANGDLFDDKKSSGEVVFKLGVTGKQGNVGFGASVYQTSTMGLENNLVSSSRTYTNSASPSGANNNEMFVGEMYITIPTVANTTLKIGKQELQTPFAFTEKWNAVPNTFNAAVVINKSIENLTLVGAYVGQGNANNPYDGADAGTAPDASWKVDGEVSRSFYEGAYAAVAHYKAGDMAANAYYYDLKRVATAYWVDAGMKVAGVDANVYYGAMDPKAANSEDTNAIALSLGTKVSDISLFAAISKTNDVDSTKTYLRLANTATGFKKTKLPTAGVYTDGVYVADEDTLAWKLKASTKLAGVGMALQYINNDQGTANSAKDTQEIDLILSKKLGDVNMKAILLDRSFDQAAEDAKSGGQHVRIIASVDF